MSADEHRSGGEAWYKSAGLFVGYTVIAVTCIAASAAPVYFIARALLERVDRQDSYDKIFMLRDVYNAYKDANEGNPPESMDVLLEENRLSEYDLESPYIAKGERGFEIVVSPDQKGRRFRKGTIVIRGLGYNRRGYHHVVNTSGVIYWIKSTDWMIDTLDEDTDGVEEEKIARRYYYGDWAPKDYQEAGIWFENSAAKGNVDSLDFLGIMHRDGKGTEEDVATAESFFEEAVQKGSGYSAGQLGWMYRHGEGVEKDLDMAVEWYERGVALSNDYSTTQLAWMYEIGEGPGRNHREAFRLYRLAAKQHDRWAIYTVGRFYYYGITTPQDLKLARWHFERAAKKGSSTAMRMTAHLYATGQGVERDLAMAEEWLKKSLEAGDEEAEERLAELYAGIYPKPLYPYTFSYYNPTATHVYVAGEFNWWAFGYMQNDGEGNWTRTVMMEEGSHAYKFVVDDITWVMDPNNPVTKTLDEVVNSAVMVSPK